MELPCVLAVRDAWATALDRRQLLLGRVEGLYSIASAYSTILRSRFVIINPGVETESILRDILLRQVGDASIVLVAATARHIATTQFVGLARPIRMPAQESLLIMLLTSLYLSQALSLAVDNILPSLIDIADIVAGTSAQVDIRQLQIVQKV